MRASTMQTLDNMPECPEAAIVTQVAVGSTNPTKGEAVRRAFAELDGAEPSLRAVSTPETAAQPWGEEQTREGALVRARAALSTVADADWGIGLEGGLVRDETAILVTSWIAACRHDGTTATARTAGFYLPPSVAAAVLDGVELTAAWHRIAGHEAIGRKGGTVGLLTGGVLPRSRLYADAVLLAVALARNAENRPAGPVP